LHPNETKTKTSTGTKNPVLDGILGGEIPGALSIAVIGAPGSGTTTMAFQFIVNALAKGKKVFFILFDYVPELAYKYFKSFGLNAERYIADKKLQIINAYDLLCSLMGISTVTDIENLRPIEFGELTKVFRAGVTSRIPDDEVEPSSIVVDSYTSLSPFVDIHSVYEVLTEGFAGVRRGRHPSLIVAHEGVLEGNFVQALTRFVDGVIRLKIDWSAKGFTRELFIEKLRFTNVEIPSMNFGITNQGISLNYDGLHARKRPYHNVTTPEASEAGYPPSSQSERVSTGIPALDAALAGGFPRGSFVCIEGDVGTGTSSFCVQFAWSRLLAGGKVAYVCIDEPPDTVINQFQSFGWNMKPYVDSKDIILSDAYDLFRTSRSAALREVKEPNRTRRLISEFMKTEGAKISSSVPGGIPVVTVIDSFTSLAPYLDLKTAYVLARIIADSERVHNDVCLTVVRSGTFEANLLYACLGTADGILSLQNTWTKGKSSSSSERRLARRMRIEKMAFTPLPPSSLEYEITPKGIRITKSG
jgi:KaiC/GvpD/RAD55 family RecA-like ATPase